MLIKSIKIFVTLIFFLSTIQSAFSESLIIPKQKPTLTKEKKYSADFIIPKFKPGTIKSKEDKEIAKEKDTKIVVKKIDGIIIPCLLYTSPSPRDSRKSRMPSSA